ncbi:glycosyltransferase 87 family protein [Streptomyces sp. NPDC088354]|uniref:glycosyltransferase 87 family protein n=1 Tax=Streptomyces sp. NPDC088354 TaxID=3365856 RepID=UPI0038067B0C
MRWCLDARGQWTAWAVTRLLLVGASLRLGPFSGLGDLDPSVSEVYTGWYAVLRTGVFPVADVTWQYPPGAALPLLAPGLVPLLDYGHAFIVCCALCDAVVTAVLLRKGPGTAAAWMWIGGLPLLITLPWSRFDVFVTATAMGALIAAGTRRRWADLAFGMLVGLGAMVKAWPLLLLGGLRAGPRARTAVLTAAATAAAVALGFAVAMPGAFDFLAAQRERGIEVEATAALPFHVARHFGWSGRWMPRDGSMEFVGPWIREAVWASEACTVLAFCWLLWWWRRADRRGPWVLPDAALTAVLLFVVTSRVLSPQYLIWLIGLASVCLLHRGTSQRPVAALLVAATVLTTLDFPLLFRDLLDGSVLAVGVLTARNLLLVAAAAVSATRLLRATRRAGTGPGAVHLVADGETRGGKDAQALGVGSRAA